MSGLLSAQRGLRVLASFAPVTGGATHHEGVLKLQDEVLQQTCGNASVVMIGR